MELYLIRHGQSVNNALMEDQYLRVADPELTDIGKLQAQRLAEYLATALNHDALVRHQPDAPERQQHHAYGLTHLYCSAMHRALQTAQPIAQALGVPTRVWLDIHEHGGIYLKREGVAEGFGGRTRGQILAEFPDYELDDVKITDDGWWLPQNGEEDLAACQGRAIRVAETLNAWASDPARVGHRVGLVSHGTFIDALIKALLNNLPSASYYHLHYNTGFTRLDLRPGHETHIRYINRITHLEPALITA